MCKFWVLSFQLALELFRMNCAAVPLLPHTVPLKFGHLSWYESNFSVPCWYKSILCVINYPVTIFSISLSSLQSSYSRSVRNYPWMLFYLFISR